MDRCKGNQSIRVVNRKDQDRNVSQISISRLQPGDSGTYYCELMSLNPPSTKGMRGNGSTLTVTESFKDPDSRKIKVQWPLLLCLLVILCVIFLVAARNRKARQKQLVEPSALSTGTVPEADYSTVNICKADPNSEGGNEEQMIYSQLQFKEKEAQFLTPCLH
ncbi:uncharacterized protein LOC144687101 [Cetorhinus maximus]